MTDEGLIGGYAQALFAVAQAEDVLPKVEDELYAFGKALEQHTDLREALTDAALPAENKKAVVRRPVGRAGEPRHGQPARVRDRRRAARARSPRSSRSCARMASVERSHALAEVRTAVDLTDEQRRRLAEALSRATGRTVDLKVVVDPSVIGGVVARVGDEVFDGSIASRLEDAKQALGSV